MPTQKPKHPMYILPDIAQDQFKFNISPTLLSILELQGGLMLVIDGKAYKLSRHLDEAAKEEGK